MLKLMNKKVVKEREREERHANIAKRDTEVKRVVDAPEDALEKMVVVVMFVLHKSKNL